MIKTAQRKVLRLIVQTKRRYKVKNKKKKQQKQPQKRQKNMEKKITSVRLIKKRKKVLIKVPAKTKTAMYLSKKTTTKKLTIQNKKKNGLKTSRELPKRQKDTWKNEDTLMDSNTQKIEMADGKKNSIPTERKMDKQNLRLAP